MGSTMPFLVVILAFARMIAIHPAGGRQACRHNHILIDQIFIARCGSGSITRSMLLEAARDYDFEPQGNLIDMHMRP